MKFFLTFNFISTFIFSLLFAQSNEDCLICHEDKSLTMEKRGREISLYVDPSAYETSLHGILSCIDCHEGFNPDEFPHRDPMQPVDCSTCHDDVTTAFHNGAHTNQLNCMSCHTDAHKMEIDKTITQPCQDCHSDAQNEIETSIHFTAAEGPECYDCHSAHQTRTITTENCLSCHGEKEFVHKNGGDEKKLKFVLKYTESIHGELIECSDCHTGHKILPADSANSTVNEHNIINTCGNCHGDIAADYLDSEHGARFMDGFEHAPNCTDCHGEHDILQVTDSESKVSRQHEVEVCERCHLHDPEVQKRMTHASVFIKGYEQSIHGRALKEGNLDAAVCSDCHGAHKAMKASNPNSRVNKFNITATCGNCHQEITRVFNESVHGTALDEELAESPTCTDCHGEHTIIEPERKESPVSPRNVSQQVCGPCHSSVRLSEKFGIPSENFKAYVDSYHGLAVKFGQLEAANCASCHGVHDILPSSNPESKIHKDNLVQTCGECHPGANQNFAKGKVHVTGEKEEDEVIYWISTIYIFLIVGTIGAMTIHNVIDFIRKIIEKYRERYAVTYTIPEEKKERHYVRMTLEDRMQHWLLLVSFLTLVVTGFMLKFPEAWWVVWIREAGGAVIVEGRGLLHRIAAVIMTAVSIYHIYYIFFTQRGRQFIQDMRFRLQDLKDMRQIFRYNLGLSRSRPKFDRFNYIEKAEYWALIWGTLVMTLTGFALWFETETIGWFSKLFLDVCETIHYFEAWLAFLAIVVWHFYYVIFNPDVYPMNFTWLTGKVTEEEMEHEHPAELERIKAAENPGETEDSDSSEK